MAPTLPTGGDTIEEKAAEELVRWQGHGLAPIALASVAAGKAYLRGSYQSIL